MQSELSKKEKLLKFNMKKNLDLEKNNLKDFYELE